MATQKTNQPKKDNLSSAQEKLMAVATQISDVNLKKEFLKLLTDLTNPNARAELDGLKTVLATDVSNTKLVAVIGASLLRADNAEIENAKKRSRQSSEAANG